MRLPSGEKAPHSTPVDRVSGAPVRGRSWHPKPARWSPRMRSLRAHHQEREHRADDRLIVQHQGELAPVHRIPYSRSTVERRRDDPLSIG